jgi:hypothetical protein
MLDDVLAADSAIFVDTDGFGESVTYTKKVGGTTRTINAVVERMSPQPGPSQSGTLMPRMRVLVRNDATYGIASSEWKNGDTITVAERRGGTAKAYQLHWPSDNAQHDAGMVTFELR